MSWLITAPGRMTTRMAMVVLICDAFLVFFATLVAFRQAPLPTTLVWAGGLGLAAACVLACGLLRRPGGMAIGTVLQVLILLTGLIVPAMWVMGALFGALWLWMGWVGQKIDRDRAAYAAQ